MRTIRHWITAFLFTMLWTIPNPGISQEYKVAMVQDILSPATSESVQINGALGERLTLCAQKRVWEEDAERFTAFFRSRNDKENWRGEYWGKWLTAALMAYNWQPVAQRRAQIEMAVRAIVSTQQPDGYIGTYQNDQRLTNWDVWIRKYVLLGLIGAYDLLDDQTILDSARRLADNMITECEQKKIKLVEVATPVLMGTADSSMLEPLALLYQRTGDARYLAFAKTIIQQWNEPFGWAPKGIHLLETALAGSPPLDNHAYGIMSCFEGICELYRATGDREFLDGAVRFAESVRKYERVVIGSVSNSERFCNGVKRQTEIMEQPLETCATVTWMKLCAQLLRLTGDPTWADELEISLYNALLGTMSQDGQWFAYFTALIGERVPSFIPHHDLNMSCCVASAPRGFLLTPSWSTMKGKSGPVINLYCAGTTTATLQDGSHVSIIQDTDYPLTGQVNLRVTPDAQRHFTVALRIPAWSRETTVTVNAKSVTCEPGKYVHIERDWNPGDLVSLTLDMRGRAVPAPSGAPQHAIMRGPVVLALDSRLNQTSDTVAHLLTDSQGHVELRRSATPASWAQMTYEAPFEVRPSHFFGFYTAYLPLCDFASAGNDWTETNLYRVWLPQPLSLSQTFLPGTWKVQGPYTGQPRCVKPDKIR